MMSGAFSPEAVGEIMREASARAILPRFRALTEGEVSSKPGGDVVTAADIEAEKILSRELMALLPGSVAVGEEACAADPARKAAIATDKYVWIIDPVDGTRNFAEGNKNFCSIVALTKSGETILGCILNPLEDQLAAAMSGAGAFLGGEKLKVAAPRPIGKCIGFINDNLFPGYEVDPTHMVKRALGETQTLRSMGLEHVELAAGRADISVYGRLDPWDHAAGMLLHKEAGGISGLADGTPYVPSIDTGLLIAASNRASWSAVSVLIGA